MMYAHHIFWVVLYLEVLPVKLLRIKASAINLLFACHSIATNLRVGS